MKAEGFDLDSLSPDDERRMYLHVLNCCPELRERAMTLPELEAGFYSTPDVECGLKELASQDGGANGDSEAAT